jgi:hypothetical protein
MNSNKLVLTASLTVLVGLILVLAATTALAAKPERQKFTLVVRDAEGVFAPADFFTSPFQLNEQATEDAPVARNGTVVGRSETIYTVTRVAGEDVGIVIECSIELPEGNLFFNGSGRLADAVSGIALPVVGGTGAYAGARGTVLAVSAGDGPPSTTLKFDITTK